MLSNAMVMNIFDHMSAVQRRKSITGEHGEELC